MTFRNIVSQNISFLRNQTYDIRLKKIQPQPQSLILEHKRSEFVVLFFES